MVKIATKTITLMPNGHFNVPDISCSSIINIAVLDYYNPVCITSHGSLWRIMNIALNSYPTCVKEGTKINVKVFYI